MVEDEGREVAGVEEEWVDHVGQRKNFGHMKTS